MIICSISKYCINAYYISYCVVTFLFLSHQMLLWLVLQTSLCVENESPGIKAVFVVVLSTLCFVIFAAHWGGNLDNIYKHYWTTTVKLEVPFWVAKQNPELFSFFFFFEDSKWMTSLPPKKCYFLWGSVSVDMTRQITHL